MEDDYMEDEQLMVGTTMAVILAGAVEAQRLCTERWNPS
jgi:hypothetical protein